MNGMAEGRGILVCPLPKFRIDLLWRLPHVFAEDF
jgi:hypothetical protein